MSKKQQATAVLLVAVIGFVITYRFNGFVGGLLAAGFLAATIGGLADWFAVTALFGKPLGFISWHTEILQRNRERIIDEVVTFIGKDMLNPEYISRNLDKYNLAQMFVTYLTQSQGIAKLQQLLDGLVRVSWTVMGQGAVLDKVSTMTTNKLRDTDFQEMVANYVSYVVKLPWMEQVLDVCIRVGHAILCDLIKREDVQHLLDINMEAVVEQYAGDSQMRQLMMSMVDVSGAHLADKFVENSDKFVKKLLAYDSEERLKLKTWLETKITNYLSQPFNRANVAKFILDNFDLEDSLANFLAGMANRQEVCDELLVQVNKGLECGCDRLINDSHLQEKLNAWAITQIGKLIRSSGKWQLDYIRQHMEKFSDEQLVTLVKSRVGDDLQMIRINGALVGSAAGMALYLISYLLERMWA